MSKFLVYSRNRDGSMSTILNNVNSVRIIERVNEPGTWTVKSRTKENSPFIDGQGIIVVKDGSVYYSGVGKSLNEVYDAYTDTYDWTASGASDLDYLTRRVCYPNPYTGSFLSHEYYTDEGAFATVIKKLIDVNLGVDALTARREPTIGETRIEDYGTFISVSLRFENLLEAIKPYLEAQSQNIRAEWNHDTNLVHFHLYTNEDLTQKFIFSTELNTVIEYTLLDEAPGANYVIGEAEINESNVVRTAGNDDSIINWGRIETYTSMNSETAAELQAGVDAQLAEESQDKTGYSAELIPLPNIPQYKKDWNLGDTVKFVINGQVIDAKVLQVETVIEHDKATIIPTIGTVYNGQFAEIYKNIKAIRAEVARIQRRK